MKKLLALLLMLMFAVTLVACDGTVTTDIPTTEAPTTEAPTTEVPTTEAPTTEAPTTEAPTTDAPTTADTTAPVLTGVVDIEIFLDSIFDPLDGVSAIDNVDGDITDEIEVSGLTLLDTSTTGEYFLKYSIEDSAGNLVEQTRYVTVVIDPTSVGDEMVQNGDFSLGAGIWSVAEVEGGIGVFSVDNEVGLLTITAAGWTQGFPRMDSNVMDLENGLTYEVTFSAKADAARPIQVQVGELFDTAPWFTNYMPVRGAIVYDLTTDWQTFSFKFTMNQDDAAGTILPGQLLFGHGIAIESDIDYPEANYNTVVYYDDIAIVESTPDADTEVPIITGAMDKTIEVGVTFDPLEGVTALDVVDGEITLDATHYVSDVDTATPGEYTVVYTVTDAAGNIGTETITITVVGMIFNPTTEIVDGTFTTTTEIIAEVQDTGGADITDEDIWYQYTAGWDGAAATFTITDGAAVIDVTASGNEEWGIQFKQKGLSLVQGETYKLSFTASSTADRDIVAKVTDNYFETFNLTSTATTFEFIFTYEGADVTDEKVIFLLANTANFAAGVVTIDDVELSQLQQDETVVNGDFENTGWGLWFQDWDEGNGLAQASYEIVNGELVVTIGALGDYNYSIQLFQEGIEVVEGTEYTITFDAKADVARDINFKFIDTNDTEFLYVASLTTTMQTFTYTFTYDGTATSGKIDFELGAIDTATTGVVTFDNVTMADGTNPVTVVNGNFDQVVGWDSYAHAEAGAAMTMDVVNGELVADVTNIGTEFWNNQIFQAGIDVAQGATYTFVFNAKASVARDINFVFIDANDKEFREVFNLTTEMVTYTFTFTYDGTATTGKLDFELGNISASSVAGIVTFDDVNIYRNYNFVVEEEEVVALETITAYGDMSLEYEITYGAIPANWWEFNVQGMLSEFDGTKESLVFTFVGEAGQDYLFKIEGGGSEAEVEVSATGSQQTATIDLSAMTETERAGLNLVIIFAQTEAATGTLIVEDVDGLVAEWVAYGDMTLVYNVTYPTVPTEWWNSNVQGNIVDFDARKNVIEFTFIGVAGQDYIFKIEDSSTADPDKVAAEITVTATGSQQIVSLDLSDMTFDERAGLDLFIIFARTEGSTGTIQFEGYSYPQWVAYGDMTMTEAATGFDITYTAIPTNWWEFSVQGTIDSFDETKTAIEFTFTGETGQDYLFKIEGEAAAEVTVTATGSQQTAIIDLSSMTETERAGLNLIIIFAKTEAATGTINIEGWNYVVVAE
jgi:hypothetical protein